MATKIDVHALGLDSIGRTCKDAAGVTAGVGAVLHDLERRLGNGEPFAAALRDALARVKKPWVAVAINTMLSEAYLGRAYGTLGKHEAAFVLRALGEWVRHHACRLIEAFAALEVAAREEQMEGLSR